MASADPLSDLLSALANASRAYLDSARVPDSKFKQAVLKALQAEGFIRGWRVTGEKGRARQLDVQLAYGPARERLLNGVERVSKPGRRVYVGLDELKQYLRRLETSLLSTPHGVLTGQAAAARKTGGELLCLLW